MPKTGTPARFREDTGFARGYQITDSSNIEYVGWVSDGMLVRFKGNALYVYKGVPRQRAVAMAHAPSVGKYLNERIKPHHEAVRLT